MTERGDERTSAEKKVSPARLAAFRVLERVAASEEHSDDLLHGRALAGLSQVDINLTNALVLGVLRWQIALDARIGLYLKRPEIETPAAVLTALRLGALQLLHMDRIPAHAAISESVELARAAGQPQAAGMVNAVLRALTREPARRQPLVESTAAIAERLGHPAWLVERWASRYGRATAVAICEFDQREPVSAGLFAVPAIAGLRIDDASRLVAEIAQASLSMPSAVTASVDEPIKVWDCCAAPGGKTAVLVARLPQASVLATDISPRRLKAMTERFGAGSSVRTMVADATALPESEGTFDLILCDAPCTGTGTLARNPEIRHRLWRAEFARQAERQKLVLAAVAKRLKPGGKLIYSTCSLEPEENEDVVDAVMRSDDSLLRVPVEPVLQRLVDGGVLAADVWGAATPAAVANGYLRTLPGKTFAADGFFAALFERAIG